MSKVTKSKKTTKSVVKTGNKTVARKMKFGEYTKIAKATGYDMAHVWRVINGERSNPSGEIMQYTNRLVSRRK